MKTSTILIRAKKYLAKNYAESDTKPKYICFAIDVAAIPGKKKEALLKLIQKRLGNHPALESWLRANHGIMQVYPGPLYVAYIDRMQKTRHAWINSLIAEFQAKGD